MRQEKDQSTEEMILEAAEREFIAKGFDGARTVTIAEAAGVTHSMLHYYFRTKEKLFNRILEGKIALMKTALTSSISSDSKSLSEILRDVINKHLDFIADNLNLPRFIAGEIFRNHERSAYFLEQLKENGQIVTNKLQRLIDSESAAGKCRKVDAKMLMLDIASLNIFPFMAMPAVNAGLADCMEDLTEFVARRKEENYDTIMRKLNIG